jgi:hypothetical protein
MSLTQVAPLATTDLDAAFDLMLSVEPDLAVWAETQLEWATPIQDYCPLAWVELRSLFEAIGRTPAVIARHAIPDFARLPHIQARGARGCMIVEVAPNESDFVRVGRTTGSRIEVPFYDCDGEHFRAWPVELLSALEASLVAASWLAGREVPKGFAITREDPEIEEQRRIGLRQP